MAYTLEQQGRIDAASKRLEAAKSDWAASSSAWNEHFVGLPCYEDTKYGAEAGATWFTPNDSSCTRKGDCSGDDKQHCKNEVNYVRTTVIPWLRKAYPELQAAQANYDKVMAQIAEEVKNDPDFLLEQQQQQLDADVDKATRGKQYIFWGIVIVVVGGLIFAWFKWGRKLIGKKVATA